MSDWNERYKKGDYPATEPHPLILEAAAGLQPGQALDIASGVGRHAIWLAENGWKVTAVDYSPAAIEILQRRSAERCVTIDCIVADLEQHEFVIQPESYDLIMICNYLQRDLFPSIKAGTRVGGVVIATGPLVDDGSHIRQMNPAYLLNPGELRAVFAGWEWVHHSEGRHRDPQRRATAEIAARKTSPNPDCATSTAQRRLS